MSLPVQSLGLDILDYDHLRNLDIKTYSSESPKILLGQDNWELIVSREVRVGPLGSPAASLTLLGWVVHGSHASKQPEKHSLLHIGVLGDDKKSQDDFELHELVKNYFSLEGLDISKASRISRSEERANSILQNTTKSRGDHWETGLLWANEVTWMPNNRESAFARLKLIERRLDRDQGFADTYYREMDRLFSENYASEVSDVNSSANVVWYLPHFGVVMNFDAIGINVRELV